MRYQKNLQLIIMAILLILAHIPSASGWDICPKATELEKMRRGFQSINHWSDEVAEYLVNHFRTPVHEWITHMIYGCDIGFEYCSNPALPQKRASDAVIAGVRWNDNPPFQLNEATKKRQESCRDQTIHLPNGAECWAILFYDAYDGMKSAEKRAKKFAKRGAKVDQIIYTGNSGHALLYRVNFGDMQFLHSMASIDGEPARETACQSETSTKL